MTLYDIDDDDDDVNDCHSTKWIVLSLVLFALRAKKTQPSTQLKDTKSHFVACKNKYKYKDQCTIHTDFYFIS